MGASPYKASGLMPDTRAKQAPSAIWRGLFPFGRHIRRNLQPDVVLRRIAKISRIARVSPGVGLIY
jgi:hypothetical protein